MSKKLIAVAAAVALALTGLVAAPANSANPFTTVFLGGDNSDTGDASTALVPIGGGDGSTSTGAFEIAVPSQDVIRVTDTASRSAISLGVLTKENGASVTVTSTGGVKLLTDAQVAAATTTSATGTQSLSLTANSSGYIQFNAYNTSTSAGSVTVQEVKGGVVIGADTIWVKGITDASNAYKINFTVPATAGIGSLVEFSGSVVDMFGNAVPSLSLDSALLGGNLTGAATIAWNNTKKVYEGSFTTRNTAGPVALSIKLAASADSVTAFGSKVSSQFFTLNAADLQATVTALQAEVAALKADYNKLAARWNKKVANKKAPKKAVTLK